MVNKTVSTEEKIITAARRVFIVKGLDGARMQEIADEAGINKALLHYYFRSKGKLFDRVFSETFGDLLQVIEGVFGEAHDFDTFVRLFVSKYIGLIRQKPFIANFVLHELNRNPQLILDQISSSAMDKTKLVQLIQQEIGTRQGPTIHPIHFIVDILSLCIFPFVARPIIQEVLFEGDQQQYDAFINERAEHIISIIKKAVTEN